MNHNLPSAGGQTPEQKKKRKLTKKQKFMRVGAGLSIVTALGGGYLAGGAGASKETKSQGIELTKSQTGKDRFEQALDPNTNSRLISEGIEASTPEASLEELFNAMGHDYRILDAYAKLTGAYFALGPEAQNNPDNAELLLSKDGKSLSEVGKSTLSFVEETLTGSLNPEANGGVIGAPHTPEEVKKMIASGEATIQFIDLKDAILDENWGPLYITGMDKAGLVRADTYNTFGKDTKAIWISYPDPTSEGGQGSLTIALSGGQPVLDNISQIDSIPRGSTEADGHDQIIPAYD